MCALFVVMKMMDCDSWEVFSGALWDSEFLLLYLIGCHVILLANDWLAGAVRDEGVSLMCELVFVHPRCCIHGETPSWIFGAHGLFWCRGLCDVCEQHTFSAETRETRARAGSRRHQRRVIGAARGLWSQVTI